MNIDLLIHIGEISGGYITMCPKTVWRVNPDGELKDSYQRLTHVFEMPEQSFFEHYADTNCIQRTDFWTFVWKSYELYGQKCRKHFLFLMPGLLCRPLIVYLQ